MLSSAFYTYRSLIGVLLLILAGCSGKADSNLSEFQEIAGRPSIFPDYPQSGYTYLTFSQSHGFQVNYLGDGGRSWLWYPGNNAAVSELWRVDQDRNRVCWSHPANSYNPVTKQLGGQESCENLTLSRKLVIARLSDDPFNISSGRVPSVLDKCRAPDEFSFDREEYRCK